jgi:hypothetical protein
MGESDEHSHLKDVALLWLLNQGCFMVDKEVPLNQIGLNRYTELDRRTIIDALGIAMRYSTSPDRPEDSEGFDRSALSGMEPGECILRGVEVKVTRSDFRAGFACSGCSYHYVLTPLRLLSPSEVPRGIGLIEYNRHKFSCELDEKRAERPFRITGLRVLKRAEYRRVPRFQVDGTIEVLACRTLGSEMRRRFNRALETSSPISSRT